MKSSKLKKEIHEAVDIVNDSEILHAVYTILKKSASDDIDLTESQKKELDKRLSDHKAGTLRYYTIDEVKKADIKAPEKGS
jgi:putative addiction module component (TIGR02574 family)